MEKIRILVDDPIGRFKAGEIGIILDNTSSKYDYFIQLEPVVATEDSWLLKKGSLVNRAYFFYKDEVEILDV